MKKYIKKIGLIPAAGFARRISNEISYSKEVVPVSVKGNDSRPAATFLLSGIERAGVDKVIIILRDGKWDIPQELARSYKNSCPIAYIVTSATEGVPYTIDKAYPFTNDSLVLFGFPDIIFQPDDAFDKLVQKQKASGADLVLGIFRTVRPDKSDMMVFENGKIVDIILKPCNTHLTNTWIIAVWTPEFSHFVHAFLQQRNILNGAPELPISEVVRHAIKTGMSTEYVLFDEGSFIDIGTPDELKTIRGE